jgi:exodeoxyribonuclease VII large subunit
MREFILETRDGLLTKGVMTVSALSRSIRDVVESRFPVLWVSGEISNYMRARSGHAYFVLKDEQAQLRCVMFRHRGQYLDWTPADGMQVEVQAVLSLYEPRGDLQLNVEAMRRAGAGALYERFLRLRDTLEKEGLFAPESKRPLPAFPMRVGVVTSTKAAALRDILSTLRRRNPAISIIVYPTLVQGGGAAARIAAALAEASRRAECDVIILARGGGSIEDLWSFNEESVARAIRACAIPVVSGVGHETDITIADLAADRRAPTPTAAAEMVSPDAAEVLRRIRQLTRSATSAATRRIESAMQRIDGMARRLEHPRHRIQLQSERIRHLAGKLNAAHADLIARSQWQLGQALHRLHRSTPSTAAFGARTLELAERIARSAQQGLSAAGQRIDWLSTNLQHLDPMKVLARGYSVVRDEHGGIVRSSGKTAVGASLDITLASGRLGARVERVE